MTSGGRSDKWKRTRQQHSRNGAEFSLGEMRKSFSCRGQVRLSGPPQALESEPLSLGRINPNGQPADPPRESCLCRSISSSPTNRCQRGSPSNHGRYFWCWKPATLWQAFSIKSAPFQRWEGGGKPSAFCMGTLPASVCVCIYLGCLECNGGWA